MLLFSLSEELDPDEGTGTSTAGTGADRGGMGRGIDNSPLGNDDPEEPATGGSLYDMSERRSLLDPQWQAFCSKPSIRLASLT